MVKISKKFDAKFSIKVIHPGYTLGVVRKQCEREGVRTLLKMVPDCDPVVWWCGFHDGHSRLTTATTGPMHTSVPWKYTLLSMKSSHSITRFAHEITSDIIFSGHD
jgi:hypothetical protein